MGKKASRNVLVVYEDAETRAAAVQFCDDLVGSFWTRCDFAIRWCSLENVLRGLGPDLHAFAEGAAIMVFALQPEGELPYPVKHCVQEWATRRGDKEGDVVGLLDPSRDGSGETSRYTWLREVAHAAGMDYLTQAPCEIELIPDTPETCSARALACTAVLDEILTRPRFAPPLASYPSRR